MTRNDWVLISLMLGGCNLVAPAEEDMYQGPAQPVETALPETVERSLSEPVAGWRWMELPETVCRDGSNTGVAIQTPESGHVDNDKLLIFLRGGNACLNIGCAEQINPSHFAESDWDALLCEQLDDCSVDDGTSDPLAKWDNDDTTWFGVVDGHPDNPFAEWTKVYVPYCSGDWFGGEESDPIRIGDGNSVFMGAANTRVVLGALRDELGTDFDQVLLTGASAGGIGAILNHHKVADLYGKERTYTLSDAGPAYTDDHVAPCFQARLKKLWRLDINLPVTDDCPGDDCLYNGDSWMDGRWSWLLDSYSRGPVDGPAQPGSRMALVISGGDGASAGVFDMMENECATLDALVTPEHPYAAVEAATHALRTDVFDRYRDVKIFHVQDSAEHMWMWRKQWWTLNFDAGGTEVNLADWVEAMLSEDPSWDHALVREIAGQELAPTTVRDAVEAAVE